MFRNPVSRRARLLLFVATILATLVSSCGGSRSGTPSPVADPVWGTPMRTTPKAYSIPLDCASVSRSVGKTIFLQTESGKSMVGTLQLVSCEDPPQLMVNVENSVRIDSTAFVRLHSVSNIIVLKPTNDGATSFVAGTIGGVFLGLALFAAALSGAFGS